MPTSKWGESFLKSGLPLEHLAVMTLTEMGWQCYPSQEYSRPNREGKLEWFEIDLEADEPEFWERDVNLHLLVECKYHDPSRFWMMLPHEPGRWNIDDRCLNFAPFGILSSREESTLLKLAPASKRGVVVSRDGLRQDDALYTAIQQVAHAFVPSVLQYCFSYLMNVLPGFFPSVNATIPVIVTNASLFRLRPSVTDLAMIRSAKDPHDVADELPWTWCYFEPSMSLIEEQRELINKHREDESELLSRFPAAKERLSNLASRPNWIAVINNAHLAGTIKAIREQFQKLETIPITRFVSDENPAPQDLSPPTA